MAYSIKLNTIDDCDFAEGAERQRATEAVGRRAPARGYCRPKGGTGGRGTTNGQREGGKGDPHAITRADAVIAARSAARPPQPALGWKKSTPGAWPGGRESGG